MSLGSTQLSKMTIQLEPARCALLLIDIQEKLAPVIEPAYFARLLQSVQVLLKACHLLQVPVAVTEQYSKGLGRTIEPIRTLIETENLAIYEKITFSALGTQSVIDWLTQQSPDCVILVGIESHICVYQTARDLIAQGFHVYVPYDVVASRRSEDRSVALELMRSLGVVITTSETLIFDWLAKAEGNIFKTLSKMIR